jgi:hypothetical protein
MGKEKMGKEGNGEIGRNWKPDSVRKTCQRLQRENRRNRKLGNWEIVALQT